MKSAHTLRVAFWLAIATLAVFAMAASSPQCARTSDEVVGPGLETLNTPDPVKVCKRDCDADWRVSVRFERKRHRDALKECNGDIGCAAEEEILHAATLAEIDADRDDCYLACEHTQGGGTGGQ